MKDYDFFSVQEMLQEIPDKRRMYERLSITLRNTEYSVSSIIGKIKANTTWEIRQHFKWIREIYGRNEFWPPGFFSSTVGIDEEVIKRYVEFQEKMDKGQLQLSLDFKFYVSQA